MPDSVDLAATNGAGATTDTDPPEITVARSVRRRLLFAGLVLFAAAWTVALIYSVTAGGRSPERLDNANALAVATACTDAQHELSALPQFGAHPTPSDEANRLADEDKVFNTMIERLRAIHPTQKTPAIALTGWLDDWQHLVNARQHYSNDLRTKGAVARFIEPATAGVDPIADKMNNWTLEQGTRTDSCNTGELQAEQVQGTRTYGAASKS